MHSEAGQEDGVETWRDIVGQAGRFNVARAIEDMMCVRNSLQVPEGPLGEVASLTLFVVRETFPAVLGCLFIKQCDTAP